MYSIVKPLVALLSSAVLRTARNDLYEEVGIEESRPGALPVVASYIIKFKPSWPVSARVVYFSHRARALQQIINLYHIVVTLWTEFDAA